MVKRGKKVTVKEFIIIIIFFWGGGGGGEGGGEGWASLVVFTGLTQCSLLALRHLVLPCDAHTCLLPTALVWRTMESICLI